MGPTEEELERGEQRERDPILNFRPFLFCALGIIFGIFLFGSILFKHILPACFVLPAILLVLVLHPFSVKRTMAVSLCFLICAGIGVTAFFVYEREFISEPVSGEVILTGTAETVGEKDGYNVVILKDLRIGDRDLGGKCRILMDPDEVDPADILRVRANIQSLALENFFEDAFVRQLFAENVRYTATAYEFEKIGRSQSPFLRLSAALHRTLYSGMGREEASVAYALLTGNSVSMDDEFLGAVRSGGIAHIFAISGLHIGILFGAVLFVSRPLGKYRPLPAIFLSALYVALCNFTVSSVRALIMCSVASGFKVLGKKGDLLDAVSLSALLILIFAPAQWYTAGFRLSFGACLGLSLFSGSFQRLFRKIRLPDFLSNYLSANLSVQLFLFPVQMEAFGYFSVMGLFLNILIVPLLPVLFLGLMLSSFLSLIIPPFAPFLLALPGGALSLLLYLMAVVDFKLVFTGFSLGLGGTVFLIGCVLLSERVRMKALLRALSAVFLCILFTATVLCENALFSSVKVCYFVARRGSAVLLRSEEASILVIDDKISLSSCEEIFLRNAKRVDLAVVLGEDELYSLNTAAFLPADKILARKQVATGFQEREIVFAEEYACGNFTLEYLTPDKLLISCENVAIEIDFTGKPSYAADLFLGDGERSQTYFCKNKIVKRSSL